jgi:hypothetical protein
VPTPIKPTVLFKFLDSFHYPPHLSHYLYQGFACGFKTGYMGLVINRISQNLKSVNSNPSIVQEKISKELALGRLAGPFAYPPFDPFICSPIGLVPKQTPGQFRVIQHLSFPYGESINDYIPEELSKVSYTKVQDAVNIIKAMGPACHLAKTDIKDAYRLLPIHPSEYCLLGFKLDNYFYYEKVLPMGLSSSCRIFEEFSTSLQFIINSLCPDTKVIHLLDDFLILAPTKSACTSTLDCFIRLCHDLGVTLAPEKTVPATQVLTFLGIELDCIHSLARLPHDKLAKCSSLIRETLDKKSVTLKALQSLVGTLNFACQVVAPGRSFLRRTIDLTCGLKASHHRRKLSGGAKQDLKMWLAFLDDFNGKWFFLDEVWISNKSLNLYTDAAGGLGYGAIYASHWTYGSFPPGWAGYNIVVLELYPILLAVRLWGHNWVQKCILFHTDNEALVYIINKQSSKEKDVMLLLRHLVLLCLKNNIYFKAVHIPGTHNNLADSLSRLQVHRFKELAPWADEMYISPPLLPPSLTCNSWPAH